MTTDDFFAFLSSHTTPMTWRKLRTPNGPIRCGVETNLRGYRCPVTLVAEAVTANEPFPDYQAMSYWHQAERLKMDEPTIRELAMAADGIGLRHNPERQTLRERLLLACYPDGKWMEGM